MEINVKYFGMIAEAINKTEEQIEITKEEGLDLIKFFEEKYPLLVEYNYRIAVNEQFSNRINSDLETATIALLPPFAGG
ncbi:MAG: MoaD/ThiS family protein [Flavobacteriales bacterium]|nr:MoaD/ThiS family protein [Flavobacteriales bacterium]